MKTATELVPFVLCIAVKLLSLDKVARNNDNIKYANDFIKKVKSQTRVRRKYITRFVDVFQPPS